MRRLALPLLAISLSIISLSLHAQSTPATTAAATPEKPAETALPATQPTTAADAPQRDTSYIDPEGRAHITRVIPVPTYLSRQSRYWLSQSVPDADPNESLAARRIGTDKYTAGAKLEWLKLYPATITEDKIADVPVRIVIPEGLPEANKDKVLLNLHGGGFNSDSGSYTESIPMAGMTKIKVVAVLYRLAPEHPFPAALDDAVAVYKELLKTYKPDHIILYGTSAGAILTAEVAAKVKELKLPMPAAMGIFSGMGDFARLGDSQAMYALKGLSGHLDVPPSETDAGSKPHDDYYTGKTDPRDPILSPIFGDLHGMPPTLFITSGRDLLLSGTINLHRAYLNAGNDARLIVYDALPHAFWYSTKLPEALEANHAMADFFTKQFAK
jgi:acetyl esterase/lipase